MIPGNGWLPAPLPNTAILQWTLPVEHQVYYYVCNPGPYDPLQPYEKPIFEAIAINETPFSDSGWKRGAWGWVVGIHWAWAYGDALIDFVWPPLEPTTSDEYCPGNDDVADDVCPPELVMVSEPETFVLPTPEIAVTATYQDERASSTIVTTESRAVPIISPDDSPA